MTYRRLLLGAALLIATTALAQIGYVGAMPQPQQPPPNGTGALEGTVLTSEGDQPVRKATVMLNGSATVAAPAAATGGSGASGPGAAPIQQQVQTDVAGHFEFRNLPAGSYYVQAQHPSYVASIGRSSEAMGKMQKLADGEHVSGIVLRLTPAAVIRGRIVDEDGEPMANLQVQVMRYMPRGGKRMLTPAGGAQTDDRGEFRVSALPAGRYYVSATARQMWIRASGPSTAVPGPKLEYVRTFYPSSTTHEGAAPVDVRAGDEVPVEFTLMKAETVLVRGVLLAPDGSKPDVAQITMAPPGDARFLDSLQAIARNGAFEVRVPPGPYQLTATMFQPANPQPTPSYAAQRIEVPRGGLDGVRLQLGTMPGATINAQVKIEGSGDVNLENSRVYLTRRDDPDDDRGFFPGLNSGSSERVSKDGTVEFKKLAPGTYDITISGRRDLLDTYVRSVIAGTHDVTATGLKISGSETIALQIVVSPAAARIEGAVLDADQHPVQNAYILAFPDNGSKTPVPPGFRPNSLATSDSSGKFRLSGMRPGRYTVVAVQNADPMVISDVEALQALRDKGETISLGESEKKQLQLRAVTAPSDQQAQ